MIRLWPNIKISLLFFAAVFLVQLALFFLAPSFYLSSIKASEIPVFIKLSFAKYFAWVLGIYFAAAVATGVANSGIARLALSPAERVRRERLFSWALQTAQFLAVVLTVGILYPAVLDWIPGPDQWTLRRTYSLLAIGGLLMLGLTLAAAGLTLRGFAAGIGGSLAPAALTLLLSLPAALNLPAAPAGDLRSVQILGFDALDGESAAKSIEPAASHLGGRLYTNAFTPLPSTHPSWNTILTGLYPKNHGVRFFFESPRQPPAARHYLANRLKEIRPYQTMFASDQPETSYFLETHGFDHFAFGAIGWDAHLRAAILNHFIFPALWLNNPAVEAATGRTLNSPSLFNYDLARYFNFTYRKLAALPAGPRFLALHNCYLHSPVRLNGAELRTVPGYLDLTPRDFSYWDWPKAGDPPLHTPDQWVNPYSLRRPVLNAFIRRLLAELKTKGYLATGTVVLLSDHGERFAAGHEIYGGIHGIDIMTREQNNVLLAVFDPLLKDFEKVDKFVGLIDVAPTVLNLAGGGASGLSYDGVALLAPDGGDLDPAPRSIWTESMGFVQVNDRASFPQIAVETLENNLIYRENGRVAVTADYYELIMKNKDVADLSKRFAPPNSAKAE